MILYSMLTMIKLELKQKVLNPMDLTSMELMVLESIMPSIGEIISQHLC